MRILVTGANGYLGRGIVSALCDIGCEVIATDLILSDIDSRAKAVEANIFHVEDISETFQHPDTLLHLAWRDGFIHNSISHLEDIPLHYAFLEKAVSCGIKDITVMGTMHEVGFFEGSINDNTICRPLNLYGIAKNALRDATDLLCTRNSVIFKWLRGFYIVGNSQYGSSIFSKITIAEAEGKLEFPFTTGQNQYDFLDYDIFCKYVALACFQNEINGIINISSGRPERLADRVERFIRDSGFSIKLKYGAFPDRVYDSVAVWGDNTKIMAILNKVSNDGQDKTN